MKLIIWICIALFTGFGFIYGSTVQGASPIAVPIMAAILSLLYFIPSFVATSRSHPNQVAIVVLNIVAGWSLLGWIVAVVWASTKIKSE